MLRLKEVEVFLIENVSRNISSFIDILYNVERSKISDYTGNSSVSNLDRYKETF